MLLRGAKPVEFHEHDIVFRMGEFLPGHPNAMRFSARYRDGREIAQTFYSIGGGAILTSAARMRNAPTSRSVISITSAAHCGHRPPAGRPFHRHHRLDHRGSSLAAQRTITFNIEDVVRAAMFACIERGLQQEGTLPGGLNVRRRAKSLHEKLLARGPRTDSSTVFEWVSLYALSVNEENAAGGRVVTAPTNGAAGILPAVLKY